MAFADPIMLVGQVRLQWRPLTSLRRCLKITTGIMVSSAADQVGIMFPFVIGPYICQLVRIFYYKLARDDVMPSPTGRDPFIAGDNLCLFCWFRQ